jgi:ABC-2 type transport system ATP-binding protein
MAEPLSVGGPLTTPAASTSRSGGSPPARRVEGLRKTYEDGFTAVAGLDLETPDDAFFGLLGPNGAGKTTLIAGYHGIGRKAAARRADELLALFRLDDRAGARRARRPQGCAQPYASLLTLLVADRAVDLLRVNSALCTAPGGRARCRG